MKERRLPELAGCTPHRRLLLHFAVAADDRHARPPLQSSERLPSFLLDERDEVGLVRIIHVGEHEIVPEQDAVRIAPVEEGVALVDHGSADAKHVHSARDDLGERSVECGGARVERDGVERRPTGAAAEDGHVVHANGEVVGLGRQRDGAKADVTQVDVGGTARVADAESRRVERRGAVRVREPLLHLGEAERRGETAVRGERERGTLLATIALDDDFAAGYRDAVEARGATVDTQYAVAARVELDVANRDVGPPLDSDLAPRTDRRRRRRPTGRAA